MFKVFVSKKKGGKLWKTLFLGQFFFHHEPPPSHQSPNIHKARLFSQIHPHMIQAVLETQITEATRSQMLLQRMLDEVAVRQGRGGNQRVPWCDRCGLEKKKHQEGGANLQGGPLSCSYKWGELTPISRVITPVTHLFSAIYRGYNSIYNW